MHHTSTVVSDSSSSLFLSDDAWGCGGGLHGSSVPTGGLAIAGSTADWHVLSYAGLWYLVVCQGRSGLNRIISVVDGPCVFGLGCLFSIVITWSVEIPYYSVPACCPGGSMMEQEQIMFLFASYYLNATVMAVWIAGVVWCHWWACNIHDSNQWWKDGVNMHKI